MRFESRGFYYLCKTGVEQSNSYLFFYTANKSIKVGPIAVKKHVKGFTCVQFCNLDFSKIAYYLQNEHNRCHVNYSI